MLISMDQMQKSLFFFTDESVLLENMPLVMRTAIAVDINLVTFQKIDLFKVKLNLLQKISSVTNKSLWFLHILFIMIIFTN